MHSSMTVTSRTAFPRAPASMRKAWISRTISPAARGPTEIFVPALQYPDGIRVEVSDGSWEHLPARQVLLYRHDAGRSEHSLRLTPA